MNRPPKNFVPVRFYLSPPAYRRLTDFIDKKEINIESFCRVAVEHLLFILLHKPGEHFKEMEYIFEEFRKKGVEK